MSIEKANEKLTKQTFDKGKQKEIRYNQALWKDALEEHNSSFEFYVLA